MKKFFCLLLALMFVFLMCSCRSDQENVPDASDPTTQSGSPDTASQTGTPEETPASDFYYQDRDNGITIINYLKNDEQVVIPSTIRNIPVTAITEGAFREAVNLKSIVFSENIEKIELNFNNCTGLTEYVVKEGNPFFSSHDGVLYNKDQTSVVRFPTGKEGTYVIPDSVKRIEDLAFYNCINLKSITIPAGVESIGARAFIDCSALVSINVASDNGFYSSLNGTLYRQDQTQILAVPAGKAGAFEIPDGVTEIGAYAFSGCKNITTVKIPDSVKVISAWAFRRCSGIKNMTLPDGIKEIPDSAFNGCTSLTTIVIPGSVTKIDDMAFYKCAGLSEIELPSGLVSIGSRAFFGCTGLSEIVIPENVETVGAVIFQECTHVNIYVKQESQPAGWDPSWNHWDFPVVWGYTGS